VTIWVGFESLQHVFITTLEIEYVGIVVITIGSGFVVTGMIGIFAGWYKKRYTLLAFIAVVTSL
jgi:hypothetical protein